MRVAALDCSPAQKTQHLFPLSQVTMASTLLLALPRTSEIPMAEAQKEALLLHIPLLRTTQFFLLSRLPPVCQHVGLRLNFP
jgi:hypothetical protein